MAQIYRSPRCMLPQSLGLHLWETKMWAVLLGKLQPDTVDKRDTCFARLAAAVLDGSFDFSSATLPEGTPAEVKDVLVYEHDLANLLEKGASEGRAPPRPAQLARFQPAPAGAKGAPAAHGAGCDDGDPGCAVWAASGECERNRDFMKATCRRSCGVCR